MKTTLELPDELIRRVKLRAVHRNQKLKDAVAQLLELGMSAEAQAQPPARGGHQRPRLSADRGRSQRHSQGLAAERSRVAK